MSAARKLLDDLAGIGATIEPAGDRLILRAGPTAIPADLIIRLRQRRTEILDTLAAPLDHEWTAEDWQAFYDERAGILEFDGGVPRLAAEVEALDACVVEWLNRNPAPSPAGLCTWCGQLESHSARVVPFGIEPGTHAWLHGECWPHWYRARRAEAAKALRQIGVFPTAVPSGRS